MKRKLLININAFYLLLDHTVSQYYQPLVSQFQYNPYQSLQNIPSQYFNQNENDKWNIQNKNYEYNDDDPETCTCDDCENLKPACRNMCPNCFPTQPIKEPMASSYMFIQVPYLYTIPNITQNAHQPSVTQKLPSTTQSTISTTTTTTEGITKASTFQTATESEPTTYKTIDITRIPVSMYIRVNDKSRYPPTALRRTKPNWIPKYGVVPISEQFAEKLILQMRNMKVLHPRRNNLRNVDDITP